MSSFPTTYTDDNNLEAYHDDDNDTNDHLLPPPNRTSTTTSQTSLTRPHHITTKYLLRPFHSARTQLTTLTTPLLSPLHGIYFLATHPRFWPLFRRRLILLLILSILIYTTLFTWTFLPQWAFLTIIHAAAGPAASFFNALILVLGEGAAIVQLCFEAFFVDDTCLDAFDGVLVAYDNLHNDLIKDLLEPKRTILHPDADSSTTTITTTTPVHLTPLQRLGPFPAKTPSSLKTYLPFSLSQTLTFLLSLPLNFIPFLGPAFFLLTNAYVSGPLFHYRYFALRGLTKDEKRKEIKKRRLGYTAFGAVALLLQLVPVASLAFLITTAAGAGLWVVRLERERERESMGSRGPEDAERGGGGVRPLDGRNGRDALASGDAIVDIGLMEPQEEGMLRQAEEDEGQEREDEYLPPYTDSPV